MIDQAPLAAPARKRFPRLRIGAFIGLMLHLPRKYLRLSVRAMIALILLLALGFGWIANRAGVQREAVAAIERAGGKVWYQWEWLNDDAIEGKPNWPQWLVNVIGIDYFGYVVSVSVAQGATDDVMAHIGRLKKLERLDLSGASVSPSETGPPPGTHSAQEPILTAHHNL